MRYHFYLHYGWFPQNLGKTSSELICTRLYNALIHKISGAKNSVLETDFTSNLTAIGMYYTEENTEFIKDSPFFKRYAEKIEETEEFNCTKKCVPLIYDSLMDTINHSIPKCTDPIEKDEFCINGIKGFETASKLKSTCMKQCRYKGTTLDATEFEQSPVFPLGNDMNVLSWPYSKKDYIEQSSKPQINPKDFFSKIKSLGFLCVESRASSIQKRSNHFLFICLNHSLMFVLEKFTGV